MKTSIAVVSEILVRRDAHSWLTDIQGLFLYGNAYDEVTNELRQSEIPLVAASRFFNDTTERLRKKHHIREAIGMGSIYYALGGRANAWSLLVADWADWIKEQSPPLECEVKRETPSFHFSDIARMLTDKPAMLIGTASIWRAEAMIRGMLDALSESKILNGSEFLNRLTDRVRIREKWSWPQTSDPFVLISLQTADEVQALKAFAPLFKEVVQEYPVLG